MNAIAVYVNTAKLVLQSTDNFATAAVTNSLPAPGSANNVASSIQELCHMLPNLRQLLSCVVCCRLVNDPFTPRHGRCLHNVCRLCVQGQKNLDPMCEFCENCQDFKAYDENKQIRCLLPCYKSLCEHLKASVLFTKLAGKNFNQNSVLMNGVKLPYTSLQEIIIEGIGYDEDILSSFKSDLPKSVTSKDKTQLTSQPSLLACKRVITPIETTESSINYTIVKQSSPRSYTPPACTPEEIDTSVIPVITNVKREVVSPPAIQHQKRSEIQTKQERCSSVEPISPTPQLPNTNHQPSSIVQLNQVKNAANITYLGPSKRGIIVPIVSSSATTTAPLSIASARLQSLNRQLAQARVVNVVSTPNSCIPPNARSADCKASIATFKVAVPSTKPILKTLKIATAGTPNATAGYSNSVTTTTIKNSAIRNPPPIKTVSNGSAMYSVLYTGIGNKITIKRKTEADDDSNQKKNNSKTSSTTSVQHPSRSSIKNNNNKRRGCRCGNATPTPGKLTCCGQRCPCYVESKSCIGCKCRGCRNPHRPGGGKVCPVIPELACYEIQMADENSNLSDNDLPIANLLTKIQNNPTNNNNIKTSINHPPSASLATTYSTPAIDNSKNINSSASTNVTNTTIIPLHNYQQLTTAVNHNTSSKNTTSTLSLSTTLSTNTNATQASLNHSTANTENSNNILQQFNQLSRESLLIQNAEGRYQVVNLFSTTSPNQNSQLPVLQRISHLTQATSSVSNNYVLPASTTIVCHTTTPQIVTQSKTYSQQQQQQQQQRQQPQQQRQTSLLTQKSYQNLQQQSNVGLSFYHHQQQAFKQPNIITVHAITAPSAASTSTTTTTTSIIHSSSSTGPLLNSHTSPAATITVSPIMVNNANGYSTSTPSPNQDAFSNTNDIQQLQVNNLIGSLPIVNQSIAHVLNRPLTVTTSARSLMKLLETKNI